MGGSAFDNFGFYTPRIPPTTYRYILEQTSNALHHVFAKVEFAIEAPEKKDHGDLDILVVPRSDTPMPSMDAVAHCIGAVKWIGSNGTNMYHFIVPWPEIGSLNEGQIEKTTPSIASESTMDMERAQSTAQLTTHDTSLGKSSAARHIQIDLTVLFNETSLRWALFVNAHGDVVNILASMIRSRGLTINNEALHVRIPGLETENRKLGRVELSRDPDQVLQFLGLDASRFWKSFTTLNDMMKYIITCRFFKPRKPKDIEDKEDNQDLTPGVKPHYSRPAFKYWYDIFLPAHENDPPGAQAHLSRDEVLEFTFAYFGEDSRQRYLKQQQEAEIVVAKGRLWSDIRREISKSHPGIPETEMQDTVKAIKREITASPNSALNESTQTNANEHDNTINSKDNKSDVSLSIAQQAYHNNDFATVISWSAENYTAVLARYKKRVQISSGSNNTLGLGSEMTGVTDRSRIAGFSRADAETYTSEDDKVIMIMKRKNRPWGEIPSVLGKKSQSQIKAHWKNELNPEAKDNMD